jgi:hypothetical protein
VLLFKNIDDTVESLKQGRFVRMKSHGTFEIDLFPPEVASPDHPFVTQFREILEDLAEEYHCTLTSFAIDKGTVSFSFDNEEITAEIVNILRNDDQS